MRAVAVDVGKAGSATCVDDLPEPPAHEGSVLVEALAVGICGTDRHIAAGVDGQAPGDDGRLVLGHESLGRVISDESGHWRPGDLVAGIVRRPDPVPCPYCEVGEWDMCVNGQYLECGIKGRHGFARQRWRIEPEFAVGLVPSLHEVGVLLEPTSVVAKAWEHIDRIGARARWQPNTALITGAGPVGLLAALLARRHGLQVHVLDQVTGGPKPHLVRAIGGHYHTGTPAELDLVPDVVLECTAAPQMILDVLSKVGPSGIVCLAGVSSTRRTLAFDVGSTSREIVLENNVIFGSVNANRRHWQAAAQILADTDRGWLAGLITRRVAPAEVEAALDPHPDDVKVLLDFTA